MDLSADSIELTGNFSTMPPHLAFAKILARIGKEIVEIRDEQKNKNDLLIGSGLSYLIKIYKNS